MAGSITLLICLLVYFICSSKYPTGVWVTLAKAKMADGGYCFVRQEGDPFPFCDVGFGYVNNSGVQHSYPLAHETFPWSGVHLVEKVGIIHVLKNGLEVAVFNPKGGYFTNLVAKNFATNIFDEKEGVSGGYGSSFFELEPNR